MLFSGSKEVCNALRILGMSAGVTSQPPVLRLQNCHERRVWCFHRRGKRSLRLGFVEQLFSEEKADYGI